MDFVGNQVVELHHVDVANNYRLVEVVARQSVDEANLAAFGHAGVFQVCADILFADTVENRRRNLDSELFASPAQVRFQNLTYVHSRGNAHGVQADFNGRAVGQVGHVLFGNDAGYDTLVAVASRHFVADLNLALRGDVNLDVLDDVLVGTVAAFD